MARIAISDEATSGLIGKPSAAVASPGVVDLRDEDLLQRTLREDARGPLGRLPLGTPGVQQIGNGQSAGRPSRKRARVKMKVKIIEFPAQKIFTEQLRRSVVQSVKGELNRVAKKLKQVKASFDVDWEQPKSLPKEKPVPKVLLVYVIDSSQKVLNQALDLATAAFTRSAVNTAEFGQHLSNEGGVNIKGEDGLVSLSFCSVAKIAKHPQNSGIDKIFADIVLHELGHAMDADHPDKGVMRPTQIYGSVVTSVAKYSDKSVRNIDGFLAKL